MDAAQAVHARLLAALDGGTLPPRRSNRGLADVGLSREDAVQLFRSQLLSRQLDRLSRKLQARGEGFYTIGSSGHEGNAALAHALRPDDMAFLHYRSAAFQIHRASQVPGETPAWDMLLSFTAAADDPISGGRHKVLGSKRLAIPPQTSTIASHLPKAVGAAFSIGIAKRLRFEAGPLAPDGVVMASFGDATLAERTFELAMTDVRSQDAPFLIRLLLVNREAGPATWERVVAAWDEFPQKFPSNTLPRMLDGVRALCSPPELAAEVTSFIDANPLAAGGRTVEQILERLAMSVNFGRREGATLATTLADVLRLEG